MKKVWLSFISWLMLVWLFAASSPVYAWANPAPAPVSVSVAPYVDPTAGGALIQILLVGIAGMLGFAKLFWRRIFPLKKGKPGNLPESADKPEDEDLKQL